MVVTGTPPNWVPLYFDVTITAYDMWGCNVGSHTVNMSSYFGPRFIGLLSVKQNISRITITTDPEAFGVLLTDLSYGPGRLGRRGTSQPRFEDSNDLVVPRDEKQEGRRSGPSSLRGGPGRSHRSVTD